MDPTLENLKSIIADLIGRQPEDIELLDTLASLGLDSLDKTELILTCENAFDIEIPEDDADGIITVAGLYDAIIRAQGEGLDDA
jgi:acyl carrier protein